MAVDVQTTQVLAYPSPGPLNSNIRDLKSFAPNRGRRSAREIDVDRSEHGSTSEGGRSAAPDEQRFVDVMMQYLPKPLLIFAT
jgi:hypothetical protein